MEYIDNLPAMDLMRSEKMTFVQLIVPAESSHRAVSYLGELGLLQFRELNADKSPFQRTFVNQVLFIRTAICFCIGCLIGTFITFFL
ncbi:hypothetical protein ACSBR2_003048 [Camellia fascicularis]